MHFSTVAAGALALAPQLGSAHFLFPHLMLNGVRTGAYEYVREHDNGFMPSNNNFLTSNDFRCNKGSWNHRNQPKTAVVTAGKDTVGFNLHLDFGIYHPGPVTVRIKSESFAPRPSQLLTRGNRSTSPRRPTATSVTMTGLATGSRCTSLAL